MPQIAPITIGSEVFGAPRPIKNGSILFIKPGTTGAVADTKITCGETNFSSTRPRRSSVLRIEEPKVVVNALGVAEIIDTQVFELTYSHGEQVTITESQAFRARLVAALGATSYLSKVMFDRDGQY